MSRAEKAALKAYPPKRKEVSMTGAIYTVVGGDFERRIFQEGYEAAEKDLALTWGDVQLLDHFVLELVREEKEGKDWGDGKGFYTEVLTRFKQFKEASHD